MSEHQPSGENITPKLYFSPVCRICGCDEFHACIGDDGLPCHWSEADLCSVCAARIDVIERSARIPDWVYLGGVQIVTDAEATAYLRARANDV